MKTVKLGGLVKITIGRTPSRNNSDYWDTAKTANNVWLSIADLIHTDGRVVNDSKEYITDVAARSFESVPRGTLLVSFKLTLGRLVFVGRELRTNEAIAALRNDESQILNEYLYYYLSHFDWQKFAAADRKVKGLTLNKAKLHEIPISFPESIEEQSRIVKKLDGAFEKIDRAIELTQKNLQNIRNYPSVWLKDILTSKSHSWEKKRLDQLVVFKGGGTPSKSKPEYWDGVIPWVSPKDMKSREIADSIDHISEKAVQESATSLVSKDSILLVVRSGILAHTIPIAINSVDVALNQDMKALTPTEEVRTDTLFSILLALRETIFEFVSKGATVHRINSEQLKSLLVSFPTDKEEQKSFANSCKSVLDQAKRLEDLYRYKLKKLEELKQAMLEEAFSGGFEV